jgi:ABC-type nitrate/sulfonate/bicarbonate transport system substrate-binding protein
LRPARPAAFRGLARFLRLPAWRQAAEAPNMGDKRVSRRRFLKAAGGATAGLAVGTVSCPMLVYAQTKKDVKFTLPWVAEGSNLIAFVAKGTDLWAKHGLNVDIARGFGSVAAAQAIGAGQFDFGLSAAPAGIMQAAKGLPVMMLLCTGYDATMGIGVLNDSPIKTPKDLEGRQMASTTASGEYPFLPAFAEKAGFDLKKVNRAQVDNKVRDRLLAERKVDAISGFAMSAMPGYVSTGVAAHFMLFSDYGMPLYHNSLMTQQARFAAEPELCAAVADGLAHAVKAVLLDPGEAMKVFLKQVPEMALASNGKETLRVGTGIYGYAAAREPMKLNGIGYYEPKDVEFMIDLNMKYVAREGEKRPVAAEILTNKYAGSVKLTPAEWDQALKGIQEFRGYLSA